MHSKQTRNLRYLRLYFCTVKIKHVTKTWLHLKRFNIFETSVKYFQLNKTYINYIMLPRFIYIFVQLLLFILITMVFVALIKCSV